jgi:hypothetical protein
MAIFVYVQLNGNPSSDVYAALDVLMKDKGYIQKVPSENYHGVESIVILPKQLFYTDDMSLRASVISANLTTAINRIVWSDVQVFVFAVKTDDGWSTMPRLIESES